MKRVGQKEAVRGKVRFSLATCIVLSITAGLIGLLSSSPFVEHESGWTYYGWPNAFISYNPKEGSYHVDWDGNFMVWICVNLTVLFMVAVTSEVIIRRVQGAKDARLTTDEG